ncbi:hypothetical protein N9878_02495 [bacterium]|nr:hypothetical protein [bacterium]
MNIDYKEKALEIHQANVAKGFYDEPKSELMLSILIKSEVYEAFEAYRAGKFAHKEITLFLHKKLMNAVNKEFHNSVELDFKQNIKDTFEDELADIWIRCMDSVGYYLTNEYPINEIKFKGSSDSFTQFMYDDYIFDIFKFVLLIEERVSDFRLMQVINALEDIASRSNIDLEKHIELKLNYNSNRPNKHGKKF